MDIGELMATTQSANAYKEGYGPDAYAGNAHLNDFSESQTERSYRRTQQASSRKLKGWLLQNA